MLSTNLSSFTETFTRDLDSFFVMLFSSSSFLIIVKMFFVISSLVADVQMVTIITCIGLILEVFGHLLHMFATVLSADDAHNNLIQLSELLYTLEEDSEQKEEKLKVQNLRGKILNTGPIAGLGFFSCSA